MYTLKCCWLYFNKIILWTLRLSMRTRLTSTPWQITCTETWWLTARTNVSSSGKTFDNLSSSTFLTHHELMACDNTNSFSSHFVTAMRLEIVICTKWSVWCDCKAATDRPQAVIIVIRMGTWEGSRLNHIIWYCWLTESDMFLWCFSIIYISHYKL